MNIFGRKKQETQQAEPAQASVADEQGAHVVDDDALEAQALESHIRSEDPAAKAALELTTFRLTPGAKSLLDRAMDNVANSDGAGLDDKDAALAVKQRAELFDAAGNDLSVVIGAMIDSCEENPREIAGAIYGTLYPVLKAAVFIANLDYRRYMDPRGDFDIWAQYGALSSKGEDGNDPREGLEQRVEHSLDPEPPVGCDSSVDRQWEWMQQTYGSEVQDWEDVIPRSLEDLRLFFQLTYESVGGDPQRIIPFGNIMLSDGTFQPINDPMLALDNAELRRKEAQARRRQRDGERMSKAAALARKAVTSALAR